MERFEPRAGLDPAADIGGWPRTGIVGGSRAARVKISAQQARWAREQRTVLAELEGGEVVVEITFKGLDFLVREVLKEAGDAVVLEPADAREAVLAAAEGLIARAT
jgi:predicted DNA-binding transcriptional regulator YafY